MAENILIELPDDLTPKQEALEIAKKLGQKSLSGSGRSQTRIGNVLDVQQLETVITIKRVSKEKPIIMHHCNVCGCEYDSKQVKYYYTNYGGGKQKKPACGKECVQFMVSYFEGRVFAKPSQFKPVFLY